MISNYLLCQYAKVKCGKIAYSNAFFTITVAVKNSSATKICNAHLIINLMQLFKIDAGGNGKQLVY